MDHGLYDMGHNFEYAIMLWVIPFVLVSRFAYKLTVSNRPAIIFAQYNKTAFKIFLWLSIIIIPILILTTIEYVTENARSDNLLYNLRYYASDDKYDTGIIKYITYFAFVPLVAECNKDRLNIRKVLLLLVLNMLLALLSMAKGAMFNFTIAICFIRIYNGKMKLKVLGYVVAVFVFLTVLFAGIRSYEGTTDDVDAGSTLAVYTLSPMVAFDYTADDIKPSYTGESTFRFFYQVGKSLGMPIEAESPVQEYCSVPYLTNVYTVFYQYYKDFGYFGIFLFAIINGIILGCIYAQIDRKPHLKVFYSYLVACLILQFFNEELWVTFSITLQVYIISRLLYLNTSRLNSRHAISPYH